LKHEIKVRLKIESHEEETKKLKCKNKEGQIKECRKTNKGKNKYKSISATKEQSKK
jgi:hypothetical protein